jgi:hypothetical protein
MAVGKIAIFNAKLYGIEIFVEYGRLANLLFSQQPLRNQQQKQASESVPGRKA